jgi:hypothetical protein
MTIGRGACDFLRGEHRAGAGTVLDDDRRAERLRKLRRDDPRLQVGPAAGREADDDANRLARDRE